MEDFKTQNPEQNNQQQSGVTEPAAGDQTQEQIQGSQEVNKEITVPLEALKQVREELKAMKEQNSMLQAQLGLLSGNIINTPEPLQHTPSPPQQEDYFSHLEDDDVLTVAEAKKIFQRMQAVNPELEKKIAILEVATKDSNYEQTIREYLPEMLQKNPSLQQIIAVSPNPLDTALAIAKMNPRYQQQNQQQPQQGNIMQQIDQILQNAQKPGSPEQFAGGGGGINKADLIWQMSDEEFDEYVNKVKYGRR